MAFILAIRVKPKGEPLFTQMYRFPTRKAAEASGKDMLANIRHFQPGAKATFAVAEEKPAKKRRK